jgi:hypothetical protein
METGASKKTFKQRIAWLGDVISNIFKSARSLIKTLISIAIVGAILFFGGRWGWSTWKEWRESSAKEDAWVLKNHVFEVGELMVLGEDELGTSFDQIIKDIETAPADFVAVMTVRSKKEGHITRITIPLDHLYLGQQPQGKIAPVVKLKSTHYAEALYEGNLEKSNLIEYVKSHFAEKGSNSFADGGKNDILYVYIDRELCQSYIMIKKRD